MSFTSLTVPSVARPVAHAAKAKRIESIDLLRGVVMIIMALDHVRGYFHYDAFLYSPTDLSKTSVSLFFTRWITHYSAPVFVFLAGTSAWLTGQKRTRKELSAFLFTRGLWLVFAELFILSLFRSFNPTFPYFNLQVIWAIGICMMVLSALIYLDRRIILLIGILLIAGHNLLDSVHVPGTGIQSFLWAVLHDMRHFTFGRFHVYVHYPLLPWIGLMAVGYYFGHLYTSGWHPLKRRIALFLIGAVAIDLFIILRSENWYGDEALWTVQKTAVFNLLSFLNVTKYPPSLLFILMTIGPALLFLSLTEKPLGAWARKIGIFGRVPMFYYMAHLLLIHVFATIAAPISGYKISDMVLSDSVNSSPALKGYGFNLVTVYIIWIGLLLILYPLCKWFDHYKRNHLTDKPWLSYL